MGRQQVPVSSCASPHVKAEVLVSVYFFARLGWGVGGGAEVLVQCVKSGKEKASCCLS